MTECKKNQRTGLLILVFASLTLVMVALSYERGISVMMHYTCPLVFAFAGITLLSGRYQKQAELWVGVAFTAWYVISRILMKELYLDYSFSMFSNLSCVYLLAFPFALTMNDGRSKNGLKAAAAIFMVGYGIIAWLGVFAVLLKKVVTVPVLNTQIMIGNDFRLWAGNHPNISACMFLVGLTMGVWLIAQRYRRWLVLPVLVLCAGAYAGIALSDSRTAMLQAGCFAAGIVLIAALRLPVKKVWMKTLIGLAAGAASLAVVFVSFGLITDGITLLAQQWSANAETVQETVVNRNILRDLTTMTGRTDVYSKCIQLLKDNPKTLLTGMLNSKIVQMIRAYAKVEHAHNSFLQTLLIMGIPGLLMAVFFAVRAVWASVKVIFARNAAFAEQMLAVILLTFLVGSIPESYLFNEYLTIFNMPFFLIFGYVLEAERNLKTKA